LAASLVCLALSNPSAFGAGNGAVERFREEVEPLLADYCYGCHGNGLKKGGVALDAFPNDEAVLKGRDLWWSVLKNVRSGLMPPAGKPRPSAEEVATLADWVKRGPLGIDPKDPDPGRVTIRRLNRVEYKNTVRDLLGVEFLAEQEFPPDDTGYGFDTIGDVLTVSPLLLEKYIQAAEAVVALGVPTVSRVVASETVQGRAFRSADRDVSSDRMSFYKAAKVSRTFKADVGGQRRVTVALSVRGAFDFDPGRCRVTLQSNGKERLRQEFGWQDGRRLTYEFVEDWEPGAHELTLELEPLTPVEKKKTSVDLRLISVQVDGPLEKDKWVRPKNFDRFFTEDDPKTHEGRRRYAGDVLRRFATRAFRRPVDERTADRLVTIAEAVYGQGGKSVEEGIAQAMVAVLASPRFLFRVEEADPRGAGQAHPDVDEYALASRLSYFLWSTMPDDELFRLAGRGELRKNLSAQVKRMLDDPRSEMLVENFTGQWLQARDVEGIAVDTRAVLARDDGIEKELKKEQEDFRAFLAEREAQAREAKAKGEAPPKGQQQFGQLRRSGRFRRLFTPPRVELDAPLREAMRRETEMFFGAVVREDRSVLDLLDCDFTFVNEKLAKFYGIPGVKGEEMRRVSLPKDSPRGGLLTQGTVLVVTSNPTRTSPVKRGLFVLDNILGTPAPPAPPDVPQLEDSEKGFKDREPTLREVLEIHRSKPLCNACHARMDPLGLALENFNALGLFREKERGQPIDAAGQLITGEKFQGIRELKVVLKDGHRADFYRCLTEKLLTYALGRGLEPSDVEAVDRIVGRLDAEQGRFSALLMGVIESVPFQKRRGGVAPPAPEGRPGGQASATP
jgi:hypothetical protein